MRHAAASSFAGQGMRPFLTALLLGLFSTLSANGQATRSITPELDATGRRGDMARLAQKAANDKFEDADEDKNDLLSRAELAKHLPYYDQNFERFDKDKDGVLNWDEFVGHDKWKRTPRSK